VVSTKLKKSSKTVSPDTLGNKNVQLVSVAKAIILDADNQMLVLRRSNTHPTLAEQSDLPGGIIDAGEEPGTALIREILEETGLVINFADLELVYTGTEVFGSSYSRLLYVVKLTSAQPAIKLSFEHDQFMWHPVAELAEIEKDYIPFYAQAFDYLIKHKILDSYTT
jgi:8-oxo-dGTP diphosphatase